MTYENIANKARQQPHIWITLRNTMATANLVTEIRKGKFIELPPADFEARSYTSGVSQSGKKQYGIEVRYAPAPKNQKTEEQKIEQLLRESFEKMLPELVRNLAEMNGKAKQ